MVNTRKEMGMITVENVANRFACNYMQLGYFNGEESRKGQTEGKLGQTEGRPRAN